MGGFTQAWGWVLLAVGVVGAVVLLSQMRGGRRKPKDDQENAD